MNAMPTGVEIGPLAAGEAEAAAPRLAGIEPWLSYRATPAGLSEMFMQTDPGTPCVGLRYQGTLAGVACVKTRWLHGPYLRFLGVLPEFQGRGVGSAALGWLEQRARVQGARHVWIMVADFNLAGRAFYARHGYLDVATVPDVVADGLNEILLRKRI